MAVGMTTPGGAGSAISPGKKERAVTATKATPKVSTSKNGKIKRVNHVIAIHS
ncbi:hypothetical protein LQF76_03085 [Gloeomargaritales cyanobacterium VI4D9]|nr:hypothetical protein LQF76_03085 [Gloeomargaritales cyanobacterium VI4D9]